MNFSQIDEELLLALDSFPELDIWTDLEKTRSLGKKMRQKIIGQILPVEGVQHADYVLPQDDAHDLVFRIYRPDSQAGPLPALLWMHGGGYCLGSMEADDHMVRQMVREVGFVVISVDYRLAPEHPFPAALNDATAALQWLADNTDTLAVHPARIAIGGISAGAGLAAGLALHTRDKTDIQLAFQFLLCPMIDDRCVTASSHMITDKRVWNRDSNLIAWKHYLHRDKTPEQELYKDVCEYAAASRATNLSGLPSAYIAVGSVDAFVDENRDYAQRLQAAGVSTQFEVFEGGFHGFEFIAPGAGLSKDAREGHYGALRIALFDLD